MQLTHFFHNTQRISVREAEILLACADGLTIMQTAASLYISVNTVKRHHTNIRNKFELRGPHALHVLALALRPDLKNWLPDQGPSPKMQETNRADSSMKPTDKQFSGDL
jgi:DNA-binding CsgD family transcriptional regulator